MFMDLATAGAAGEYGTARYFFHRTMMRGNAEREQTQKMTGTDWDAHIPGIRTNKEWLVGQEKGDVFITSADGLKLHGTFFPCEGSKRAVVCFHGYANEGLNDSSSITRFYLEKGFSLTMMNERVRGKSEGTYIGFSYLDCHDALGWIRYVVSRLGRDYGLMLRDISMGGAVVLMTTRLALPPQARAAVSNCVFTSVWEMFDHVLKFTYHTLAFPATQTTDRMAREEAGYGLNECNTRDGVRRAKIPILFIHGDKDALVPCSMIYDFYNACRSPKSFLVVSGVSHAEAYYKDTGSYESAVNQLICRYLDH